MRAAEVCISWVVGCFVLFCFVSLKHINSVRFCCMEDHGRLVQLYLQSPGEAKKVAALVYMGTCT
jgi:hypothetical protein